MLWRRGEGEAFCSSFLGWHCCFSIDTVQWASVVTLGQTFGLPESSSLRPPTIPPPLPGALAAESLPNSFFQPGVQSSMCSVVIADISLWGLGKSINKMVEVPISDRYHFICPSVITDMMGYFSRRAIHHQRLGRKAPRARGGSRGGAFHICLLIALKKPQIKWQETKEPQNVPGLK